MSRLRFLSVYLCCCSMARICKEVFRSDLDRIQVILTILKEANKWKRKKLRNTSLDENATLVSPEGRKAANHVSKIHFSKSIKKYLRLRGVHGFLRDWRASPYCWSA